MAFAYLTVCKGKWDVSFTVNGFLAGLVGITCPCYWVSPFGSILIGVVAGAIVVLGVELLEWLRIDDPIGAVPVHGFCGIWGTLSLGLFACGKYGATGPLAADNATPLTGLFYGGGVQVLAAQFVGSVIVTVATFVVAMMVMTLLNAIGKLRVSEARRALWPRPARAWHFGLSGVCDLLDWPNGRYGGRKCPAFYTVCRAAEVARRQLMIFRNYAV